MGIKFRENFNFPYHSNNPKMFWKRWHISLSSWVRDYIYLPLLKTKPINTSMGGFDKYLEHEKIKFYTLFALLITWSLMGLWHGASWNFVFWGIWNFFVILIFRLLSQFFEHNKNYFKKFLSWFISINLIMLGWIFFRSENLNLSFQMLSNIFIFKKWTFLALKENTYIIAFLTTFFYLISPFVIKLFNVISKRYKLFSDIIFVLTLVISLILIFIYHKEVQQFIYFQF